MAFCSKSWVSLARLADLVKARRVFSLPKGMHLRLPHIGEGAVEVTDYAEVCLCNAPMKLINW